MKGQPKIEPLCFKWDVSLGDADGGGGWVGNGYLDIGGVESVWNSCLEKTIVEELSG